jgi:predicted O-methyltransferase YrrM
LLAAEEGITKMAEVAEVEVEKFAFDTVLEARVLRLVEEYGIQSVIETGTWIGGTARAMSSMVRQLYTVEVNHEFYMQAQQILGTLPNVRQFLGQAQDFLPSLIRAAKKPTLYYLDAHWHGSHPLLEELEHVVAGDESPIIVMHDMQVPGHPELKYDPRPGGLPYCYEWVEPVLRKIRRPWRHFYNDEAVGCRVGVLFVVPVMPQQ